LKNLETERARLKRMLAEQRLLNEGLREYIQEQILTPDRPRRGKSNTASAAWVQVAHGFIQYRTRSDRRISAPAQSAEGLAKPTSRTARHQFKGGSGLCQSIDAWSLPGLICALTYSARRPSASQAAARVHALPMRMPLAKTSRPLTTACTADQWNAIAKFSAIEIEQPMPVAGLLVRHCVEHVRCMGIRLAQTLSELAVNARILLLERDGKRQQFLFGEIRILIHVRKADSLRLRAMRVTAATFVSSRSSLL
jgi:hypothetical protein